MTPLHLSGPDRKVKHYSSNSLGLETQIFSQVCKTGLDDTVMYGHLLSRNKIVVH